MATEVRTDGYDAERSRFAGRILTELAAGAADRWATTTVHDGDGPAEPDPAASPGRVVLAEAGIECHSGGIGVDDVERALHTINTQVVAGLTPELRGQLLKVWFRLDADAVTPAMADVIAQVLTFGEVVHRPAVSSGRRQ